MVGWSEPKEKKSNLKLDFTVNPKTKVLAASTSNDPSLKLPNG